MHVTADARIRETGNVLIAPTELLDNDEIRDFCGSMIKTDDLPAGLPNLAGRTVYLCGDVSEIDAHDLAAAERVFVVRELSRGAVGTWTPVGLGQVPVLVHGVGVYYRRFFDDDVDHFGRISAEHEFQPLTESTKPGTAHRTGIYLTPVEQDGAELHFRLLRCSTNFAGPSENFRATDERIVEALNREAAFVFENHAPLNHVLAQIYHNTPADGAQKQSKARISAHADKTKDMPANGIMAFCTFYAELDKLRPLTADPFDHGYKGLSGLARLRFHLKEPVADLPAQFTVTLYPDSVFFMPLSTNRLYTHEIRSSTLNAELLPTRLGYVARCSNAEAVHSDGRTFLEMDGQRVPLAEPTPEGLSDLRARYAEENKTNAVIDYGDQFLFSMNTGDYRAPRI